MRALDLADLVALAAEVSEVEVPKVLELLDTAEVAAVLADAHPPLPPHHAAAVILTGIATLAPLPAGNRRLALLAALHLLAVNGLEATLDPAAVADLFAAGADVTALLEGQVTARTLEGELRRLLAPDAEQAIALALQRARRHRRHLASPGDLLLGVFRAGGSGGKALGNVAGAVQVLAVPPRPLVPVDRRSFDADARRALALAFGAATTMSHPAITTGHLLLGLLDGGHSGDLPEGLDPADVRRRVLDLLRPPVEDDRLARIADRVRDTDPAAAAELDEVADLHRAGLDRLVEMVRAWRGEIFLEALAKDTVIVALLGTRRLEASGDEKLLAAYLADIAQYPTLTREEEVELAQSIQGDARRQLIQSHLQLVVRIARGYEGQGLPLVDLIQEGNLGLLRAAERFDPTKGYRFSTFATWWVRHAIEEAIAGPRR